MPVAVTFWADRIATAHDLPNSIARLVSRQCLRPRHRRAAGRVREQVTIRLLRLDDNVPMYHASVTYRFVYRARQPRSVLVEVSNGRVGVGERRGGCAGQGRIPGGNPRWQVAFDRLRLARAFGSLPGPAPAARYAARAASGRRLDFSRHIPTLALKVGKQEEQPKCAEVLTSRLRDCERIVQWTMPSRATALPPRPTTSTR
jgi:hypothetical protein